MRKIISGKPSALKATKVQLRLRPAQKAVLARAAQLRQTSLSKFMLEHAYEAAQQVLAEQLDIVRPPGEWDAFCKALNAPPRKIPAKKNSSPSRVFSMPKKSPPLSSPTLFAARHDLADFDCDVPALNNYLKTFALQKRPVWAYQNDGLYPRYGSGRTSPFGEVGHPHQRGVPPVP